MFQVVSQAVSARYQQIFQVDKRAVRDVLVSW